MSNTDLGDFFERAFVAKSPHTVRAIKSDLAYIERWAKAILHTPLPWPASEEIVCQFIEGHSALQRSDEKVSGPTYFSKAEHAFSGQKKSSAATLRRRISSWAKLHRVMGLVGPFSAPSLRLALKVSCASFERGGTRDALDRGDFERMLATCRVGNLAGVRDRALLLIAFEAGGRRPSEIAGLRVEQIKCGSSKSPWSIAWDQSGPIVLSRPCSEALAAWLRQGFIVSGAVFRPISRGGKIGKHAITTQSVNLIVKRRLALAGLPPAAVSAHGLRLGFFNHATEQGLSFLDAKRQSGLKSIGQAARLYFKDSP